MHKLRYFGKELSVKWEDERTQDTLYHKQDGKPSPPTPYLQQYFVARTTGGRIIRITRNHHKPIRDDFPVQVRGVRRHPKTGRERKPFPSEPQPLAEIVFADGESESVGVVVSRSSGALGVALSPEDRQEVGCLTIYRDFREVMCRKRAYDLTDADQAREMLCYLCSEGAVGKDTGKSKAEILNAIRTAGVEVAANDWRPASVFRRNLKSLYGDAIGRGPVSNSWRYWIKS